MTDPVVSLACHAGMVLLLAGFLCAFIRLLRGPSLPDRVVALDVMATMAIGALALVSIRTGQPILLDVALGIAIITFLGTVALAISLERGIFK